MPPIAPMGPDVNNPEITPNAGPGNTRFLWTAWLVLTAALALVIGILALTPVPTMPRTDMHWDKVLHAIAFMVLVLPTAALWPRAIAWVGLLAVIYGGAIELIQPFTGRSAELADLVADGIGVGLGIILGSSLRRTLAARRTVRSD